MFGRSIIARTVRKYGKTERNAIAALLAASLFSPGTAHRNRCASER
jgi:hypothetical protein